jgi:glycine/D-amino acid oxidase-like deaminating enzyme
MKTIPYWTDNTPFPKDISSADLPGEVDVAVVGSGYTGLNAALVMAKAGLNVAVFEKEKVGWGASSRNGGLIGSGLSLSIEDLEARYGKSLAQAFWRWSIDALDYIDEIIKIEKISCDFARSGEIVLASKPSHFEGLPHHHHKKRNPPRLLQFPILVFLPQV